MNHDGFVYFIRCLDRVKIGFSTQPLLRLAKINTDAPHPCELLGFVSSNSFTEAELHKKFSSAQVHGEWFELSPEISSFISEYSFLAPVRSGPMNALDVYFSETGENPHRLAAKIGCSASTITRPLRGDRNPSVKLARRIERHTDGRVTAQQFIAICLEAQSESATQ